MKGGREGERVGEREGGEERERDGAHLSHGKRVAPIWDKAISFRSTYHNSPGVDRGVIIQPMVPENCTIFA